MSFTIFDIMRDFSKELQANEGEPFSRFKSWEYCYTNFQKYRKHRINKKRKDYLALHLSFYLASWGMYRGSSFLLQRDYKTHKKIIDVIYNKKYKKLWNYNPIGKDKTDYEIIGSLVYDAYQEIEKAYGKIPERFFLDDDGDNENPISTTLITKILMGTYGISPAFDQFFINGIAWHREVFGNDELTYASYFEKKDKFEECLISLFEFAAKNQNALNSLDDTLSINYPIMKKVDMYFWELGYERALYGELVAKRGSFLEKVDENNRYKQFLKSFEKTLKQVEKSFSFAGVYDANDKLEFADKNIPKIKEYLKIEDEENK